MRKSILFTLIFLALISIGFSQVPWHSNIHLNRLKVDVYAYLPYNYSDVVEYIYGIRPTELIVTIPVAIDTESLEILNCSEVYIYSLNDNNFVYFYVTETGDLACGTDYTHFYVRMKMKFIGKDTAMGVEVWKNTIYLYFNPVRSLSVSYLNFSRAFSNKIDLNGFRLTLLNFGYEEPNYDQYRYNYIGGLPRNDVEIDPNAPTFAGYFFSLFIKPKLAGLGTLYFSASNIDDYLVVCTQTVPNSVSTNCKDRIIDSTQNTLSGSYTFTNLDAVPFIVYLKNSAGGANFDLYIKHSSWDIYRKININDPTIQSYYEIGSMAGYDPVSNKDVSFPAGYYIANYDINNVELNINYIAQNYRYVIEIMIDTTNVDSNMALFAPDFKDGQIFFILDTKSLISNGYLDPECSNILFVYEDKIVRYFWFDREYCNSTETLFFVRIPNIPPGNIKKLYMYMSSNPVSYNNFYDPYGTFIWFVDFNSLSDVYLTFDTSGAEYDNKRYFNVSGGKLYVYPSDRGTTLKRKVYYPEYGFVTRVGAEPFSGIRALFTGTGYLVRYDANGWFSGYDPTGQITTFFWMNMFYHEIQTMIIPEVAFHSVAGYLYVDYLYYYFRAINETSMNEVYLGYVRDLGIYPSITHQIGPVYTGDINGPFYFEYFGFFIPKSVNASIYVGTPTIYVPPAVCWIAADSRLVGNGEVPGAIVDIFIWKEDGWYPYSTPITPFNITVDCNQYYKLAARPPSGYSFYDVNYSDGVFFISVGATYAELQASVTKGLYVIYDLTIPAPYYLPTYYIYLNATDQYGRFVSTNVYINGTRYSTGTTITLYNETYSISADIPANYSFVRWESKYGNITFANQYNLTTLIRVWGNDVLTLILSYSPPAPPAKYRVYCYIYDTYNQPVEDAFLIIGGRGCPYEAYLDLDADTYSLDVSFNTSEYSFNRYSYSGNIYISNIYSKTTSVTVNGNGTIIAYLNKITAVTPTPPPGGNMTLPSAPFINYFGFDKLLTLILILVVGGILAIENIIVGSAFLLGGLILTFLGIDAIAVVIIIFSFIVSYVIIKIIRR